MYKAHPYFSLKNLSKKACIMHRKIHRYYQCHFSDEETKDQIIYATGLRQDLHQMPELGANPMLTHLKIFCLHNAPPPCYMNQLEDFPYTNTVLDEFSDTCYPNVHYSKMLKNELEFILWIENVLNNMVHCPDWCGSVGGCCPANPKVTGQISGQGPAWAAVQVPGWGHVRGNQSMFLSLSFSLSSPLSKK